MAHTLRKHTGKIFSNLKCVRFIEWLWRCEACDVRWHIGWLWGCRRVKLNLWERLFGGNQGCFSRPGARWRAGFCQFTLTRRAPLDLCRNSPNSSTGDQSRPHHRRRAHETFPWLSSLTRDLFLFSLVISQCCFQRKIIIIYQRSLFDLFWLENNDTAVAIIDSFAYFRSSHVGAPLRFVCLFNQSNN